MAGELNTEEGAEKVRAVVFAALASAGLKWQVKHATDAVMRGLEKAGLTLYTDGEVV